MKIEELELRPYLFENVEQITGAALRGMQIEKVEDHMRDRVLFRFSREIMCHKVDEQQHEWVEEPVWKDPRAHYVASLPDGFRKRFLTYFWQLGRSDLQPLRVRHRVKVARWARLPELPPQSGRVFYQQVLDDESGWV